ncbi:MAG: winged helix-turn-helix domain-containing protein, partial [Halobacteriovoraceae bacterium]|nr:winged helix-turn-helix domain-containing protein [Halobacteriovoraceae bacterium]
MTIVLACFVSPCSQANLSCEEPFFKLIAASENRREFSILHYRNMRLDSFSGEFFLDGIKTANKLREVEFAITSILLGKPGWRYSKEDIAREVELLSGIVIDSDAVSRYVNSIINKIPALKEFIRINNYFGYWVEPEGRLSLRDLGKKTINVKDIFYVDPESKIVLVDGEIKVLSKIRFAILRFLARNPGKMYSFRQVSGYLRRWGIDMSVNNNDTFGQYIKAIKEETGLGRYIQYKGGKAGLMLEGLSKQNIIDYRGSRFDPLSGVLTFSDGNSVTLSPVQAEVYSLFASNVGWIYKGHEIIEKIAPSVGNIGGEHLVSRLNEKLSVWDHPIKYIEKVGYHLEIDRVITPDNLSQKTVNVDDLLYVDSESRLALCEGRPIIFSDMERRFLLFFMNNMGDVSTPREIIDGVYGKDYWIDEQVVKYNVLNINNKLASDIIYIKSFRGKGYSLVKA